MNKKQKNPIILLSLLLLGGMTLGSCMDDNYDLGDIDGTVAFGSDEGITLPGNNSTAEIMLSDILDIDESDCITTLENGDYVFFKKGDDVEPARPFIDRIRITKQSATDIPQKVGPDSEPADLSLLADGATISGTAGSIEKGINIFDYRGDKPESVVDLHEVDIEGNVTLNITFNSNLQAFLTKFSSFDICFPAYMTLKSVSRGTVVGNTIVLGEIPTAEPLVLEAVVDKLNFGVATSGDNELKIDGEQVVLKGEVVIKATYPDFVKGNGDITDMQIQGVTNISNIDIVSARGLFKPSIDIDNVGDIEITDVPDFLDDPEVDININDPQITLNINSNMDVDGFVDGTLTAFFKDGTQKSVTVNDIEIPRQTNSKILICRQPKTLPYEDYTQVKVVSNLSDLIKTIPEKISFKANAQADATKQSSFMLGYSDYLITTGYKFEAKLALDAGSVFIYNDTIDGWNADLEDIDLAKNAKVKVTFDVTNNVPAKIDLEVFPVDINGNDLNTAQKALFEVKNPATVGAGSTKDVTVEILQKEANAFRQLDGIRIRAKITSLDATPLNNTTQTIKLENITATLVGKVVIEDKKD